MVFARGLRSAFNPATRGHRSGAANAGSPWPPHQGHLSDGTMQPACSALNRLQRVEGASRSHQVITLAYVFAQITTTHYAELAGRPQAHKYTKAV